MKPRVAFVGTGGTLASVGRGPLDLHDYGATGRVLHADEVLERFPEAREAADVFPVRFSNVPSTRVAFPEWRELLLLCDRLAAEEPGLAGIVIGHGTSSLEETAYFLSLTLKHPVPVVLVGSQRPNSALSTDAGLNLVNAVRVAASPEARGLGALVVLNDEVHAAREVAKTATARLQTFRSPDFGCLAHADGDRLSWYRRPLRRAAPDTEFDPRGLQALPRVDIAYSYAGADGAAIEAFRAAGARGIVSAGFAPGFVTPAEGEALRAAVAAGVAVAQSTRSGSGRVFPTTRLREAGFIPADNLTPQKARVLLALALTVTRDPREIERIFGEY
ncbi:MAG: asparaginase [Acetobacteraceae bacterium]|nr:asparaginase [Acetobacteraceae bacterium]